uniref:Zinc finger protein 423 n=1 Tax=Cacopsylla melanoneura TaxID=428564 RepID=A0A8D8Q4G8_9HEMI
MAQNTLSNSVATTLQSIQHSVATSLQSIQHSVATSNIQNSVVSSMASLVPPSPSVVKSGAGDREQQQLRKMIEFAHAHAQAEKQQKNGGGKSGGGAGSNQFSCSQCSASFDSHEALQNHIVSQRCQRSSSAHTTHECRLCCQIYPDAVSLQAHLIEHTFEGLSSYTCFVCLTQFTGVTGLQSHIRTHHPGPASRSYECSHCPDVRFFFKAELENHTLIVHGTGETIRQRGVQDPTTDYEKMSSYFQYQKSLQQYQQQQQLQYKQQLQQRSDENNSQRSRNGRSELSSLRENHRELLAKRRKYSAELNKTRDETERHGQHVKKEIQKYEENSREHDVEFKNEENKHIGQNEERNDNGDCERSNNCDGTDQSFGNNNQSDDSTKIHKQNDQDSHANDVDMYEEENSDRDEKNENLRTQIENERLVRPDESQDVDMNGEEERDERDDDDDEEVIGKLGKIKRESINEDGKEDKCDREDERRIMDDVRNSKSGEVKVEIKKEVLAEDEDIDVGNHC